MAPSSDQHPMPPAPVVWLISGEASGDLYGAEIARSLREQCPAAVLRGMGGEKMREAGVEILVDSTELGIIGLWEAIKHLPFFIGLRRRLVQLAARKRPDTVVMIDYPGFNLALAGKLHQMGIRIVWFVSPQVWAWRTGRIWKLARCCARMLCIFPFEPPCYAPTALKAEFVGHPLVRQLEPFRNAHIPRDESLVLLLPGSRRQELRRLLKPMLEAAALLHRQNPKLRFEIAFPRPAIAEYAEELIRQAQVPGLPPIQRHCGVTRQRMAAASAAIAASGTVTVEAALLGLPVVVVYKVSPITWWLGRMVVKINTITIANMVCGRKVFEELVQDGCVPADICRATLDILPGGGRRQDCLEGIREFTASLGAGGDVGANVARAILDPAGDSGAALLRETNKPPQPDIPSPQAK